MSKNKTLQELLEEAKKDSPINKMTRQQAAIHASNIAHKKGIPTNLGGNKGSYKSGGKAWNKGKNIGKESWGKTRRERAKTLSPEEHKAYFGTVENHTEKTKKQMSDSASKRWANLKRPKVIADGIEYENFIVCAEKLQVHKDTVSYRCKSKSKTWEGWFFEDNK